MDSLGILIKYNLAFTQVYAFTNLSLERYSSNKNSFNLSFQKINFADGISYFDRFSSLSLQKREYFVKKGNLINGLHVGPYLKYRNRKLLSPGSDSWVFPSDPKQYKADILLIGYSIGIEKIFLKRIVFDLGHGIGIGATIFSKGKTKPSVFQGDFNPYCSLGFKFGKIKIK